MPVLGFPLFLYFRWWGDGEKWLAISSLEKYMHLNGLHRLMKSFCFALSYFFLKYYFKAFYRYIYHISEPVSSYRVSVHHWSALVQNRQKVHCLFSYFIKAQCWYCECTQIKVDPSQFQMIYYSYLYEKKKKKKKKKKNHTAYFKLFLL